MTETAQRVKQILVAGIGNAWLRDDGFGGEVAKLLSERELPPGVQVIDFGSGGLDLAYEVMRGYDALVLVDVSRQGGTPGTLYVMEADPDDVDGKIEDGQMLDPHGMDPETVLRFVKYVGGWPGRVFVVACEPEVVEDVGFGLSESVSGSVARAADVVLETVADLRARAGIGAGIGRTLSGLVRKYGDTESGSRRMPGEDGEGDVHWWCMSLRGQSQAPPGAARMSSYLRTGPLSRDA